jgi:hypothetical protein
MSVAVFDYETVHNLKWNTAVYNTILNSNNSPYHAHPTRNTMQGSLVSVSASVCKENTFFSNHYFDQGVAEMDLQCLAM